MAIARTVPPPPAPPPTIVLELSQDEAQFLIDLLGTTVYGCSTTSRRGLSDVIHAALEHVGLRANSHAGDLEGLVRVQSGRVRV